MSVSVGSLYKVEEETADRLVLRAKKIGAYLGGAFFTVVGLIVTGVAGLGAMPKQPVIGWIGLALGLLSLWAGIALIRTGIKNEDRIVIDRVAAAVRFEMTRERDRYSIPFSELGSVALRVDERRDRERGSYGVYQIFVVKKDGDEVKLDESTDVGTMLEVALKASSLSGAPLNKDPQLSAA